MLVAADGALPRVRVEWFAADWLATAAGRVLREIWGLEVAILEMYGEDDDDSPGAGAEMVAAPVLVVVEAADVGWRAPTDCRWWPLGGADPGAAPSLRPRLIELLAEWRGRCEVAMLRPPWARPGWHRRARDWISQRLVEAGRPPTGPIEQVKHWELSAVMCVDTARGRAWFKAVFPLFDHEPVVTALLDREMPGTVAAVIAIDHIEGWLLLDDVGSEFVADHPEADAATIRRLVECQRSFIGRTDDLLAIGCPVRPFRRLAHDLAVALADPALRAWVDVADQRVDVLVAWVDGIAAEIDRLGFPDTLVHGDFHPQDAVVTSDGPVIFDWSDAAIANPLVDAMTWSGWLNRDAERGERAWRAFLDAWADVCPIERVEPRRPQLAGLAAGYHTVSYAGIVSRLELTRRSHLAGALDHYFRILDHSVPR